MNAAWIAGLAAASSAGVIAWMLRSGRVGAIDLPNERSLHAHAVPRSGGLGVLAGLATGLMGGGYISTALVLCLVTVAGVSWLDDRHNLPARVRFAVHLLAALALAMSGLLPAWGWAATMAMVLGVVWLTNLYNFMDGSDGLAGGMAVCGFGCLGLAAITAGANGIAMSCLAAAGGAAGFLMFNFPPARIFMGDVGSIPLGFLAAALGLIGVRDGLWPLAFPVLVFSPFMVDATLTLARRALRGERVWQAHREHYYQRLVQSGWSHRRVALVYYVVMLAAGGCAFSLLGQGFAAWLGALVVWASVYVLIAFIIDRHWQRHLLKRQP